MLLEGLTLAEGETDALGLGLRLTEALTLLDGETELLGEIEDDGEMELLGLPD